MTRLAYDIDSKPALSFGLIVLQSDETIEGDIRQMLPQDAPLFASRVPSGEEVSRESLRSMKAHMTGSAALFPRAVDFDVIGYGCTSGTAQIGRDVVKALIEDGAATKAVTQPVDALISACKALSLQKLGFVSPYVEDVSGDLRDVLLSAGIESPAFGSFEEAEEAKVARITPASLMAAADTVAAKGGIDALFLSCTNLRTLSVIEPLEARLGIPVLSSNQVLAWHMAELAGATGDARIPGRLGNAAL